MVGDIHCGVKLHSGAGIVRAAPSIAVACGEVECVNVAAVAIGRHQAILRCDIRGLTCIAGGAIAVGVCFRVNGDQQLVGRDHRQTTLLYRHAVVAVQGRGGAAQIIDPTVGVHHGPERATCVDAVGHIRQYRSKRVAALQTVDVLNPRIERGTGILRDKSGGVGHLDRQGGRSDGAHVANGGGGQAVVAQQRVCVCAQLRKLQRCAHYARAAVVVHVGAGIRAVRLRDAGAFAGDKAAQAEVAGRQGGVGVAVVSFAHAAHQAGGQCGLVDGAGTVACACDRVIATIVAIVDEHAVQGDCFVQGSSVLVGIADGGRRDAVASHQRLTQCCQI